MSCGYAVFETALGWCGIAWSEAGVTRGSLPAESKEAARASIERRSGAPEAEPPWFVAEAIAGVQAMMRGEAVDLSGVPLDATGHSDLHRRVWEIARGIPLGETLTYGAIAERLGDRNLAREVGRALGLNPYPPIVPCHRILAASGKTGGFSAPGGVDTKMRLLSLERARTTDAPSLFDDLPLAAAPRR